MRVVSRFFERDEVEVRRPARVAGIAVAVDVHELQAARDVRAVAVAHDVFDHVEDARLAAHVIGITQDGALFEFAAVLL